MKKLDVNIMIAALKEVGLLGDGEEVSEEKVSRFIAECSKTTDIYPIALNFEIGDGIL